MTFKKNNKSACPVRKEFFNGGQAIFEYFILTAVVVTVVFLFLQSTFFTNIKTSCENAFNQAVGEMLK